MGQRCVPRCRAGAIRVHKGGSGQGKRRPAMRVLRGGMTLSRSPKWASNTPGWAAASRFSDRRLGGQKRRRESQQLMTMLATSRRSRGGRGRTGRSAPGAGRGAAAGHVADDAFTLALALAEPSPGRGRCPRRSGNRGCLTRPSGAISTTRKKLFRLPRPPRQRHPAAKAVPDEGAVEGEAFSGQQGIDGGKPVARFQRPVVARGPPVRSEVHHQAARLGIQQRLDGNHVFHGPAETVKGNAGAGRRPPLSKVNSRVIPVVTTNVLLCIPGGSPSGGESGGRLMVRSSAMESVANRERMWKKLGSGE